MPRRATEIGPAGERTAHAIERLRTSRGFAQRELAARVTELGHPMNSTMLLSRIERTRRRCDVDDLVAIAAALGVSPLALLQPAT
ncbi:helix-turn-helix domain-containing protein [Streptomyces sp. NPDC048723]|uniref:helix-turn-helix domain-containing protein n=1 Tax=Streptomyces sp. NPDC048723 TaxID=3365589 RepID=UPI00371E8E3A